MLALGHYLFEFVNIEEAFVKACGMQQLAVKGMVVQQMYDPFGDQMDL